MSAPLNIGALLLADLFQNESRFASRTGPDDRLAAIVTHRCLLGWLRAAGVAGASEQEVAAVIQSFVSWGWITLDAPLIAARHPLAWRPIRLTLAGRQAARSPGLQAQAASARAIAAYCRDRPQVSARVHSPMTSPQPAPAGAPSPAPGGAGAF